MANRNNFNSINPHRLYRNPSQGRIGGVCAGVAEYYGVPALAVRIGFVFATILLSPLTLFVYAGLVIALPKKPAGALFMSQQDEEFWRSVSRSPKDTLSSIHAKFERIKNRIHRIEDYVTSSEFETERKFKNI